MTLQDTKSSAMLTGLGDRPTRATITLLNEAGVGNPLVARAYRTPSAKRFSKSAAPNRGIH
jgi:hypothetical protein